VLSQGQLFRFDITPVDPGDPFRGRYINVHLADDRAEVVPIDDKVSEGRYYRNRKAYVTIAVNEQGVASIDKALFKRPDEGAPFIVGRVNYWNQREKEAYVRLPLDRFYMNEKLAPEAERVYRDAVRTERVPATYKTNANDRVEMVTARTTRRVVKYPAYAMVRVLNGAAAIEDITLDGRSLRDWAKNPPPRTDAR
jgi:uncharacterized membrane-anchored protein